MHVRFLTGYRTRRALAHCLNVGCGVTYDLSTRLVYPGRISLGNHIYIGPDGYLNGRGGITIHDFTILAPGVVILTAMHRHRGADLVPYDQVELLRPVTIERCVWIGMRAMIMPGVTVGEGSIIGAGAVVIKSCAPGTILGGNPAMRIGERDMDHYYSCVASGKIYMLIKHSEGLTKIEHMDQVCGAQHD